MIQLGSTRSLVRASAGSGKTYTLTIEYIARLLLGEDPSAILATTFTKAAAGEIRGRVLGRLAEASIDDEALQKLAGEVRRALEGASGMEIDRGVIERTLRELVERVHELSIMTIDSFVARLAGAYGFELGLAPGWRMIDEEEDAILRDDAIARTIDDAAPAEVIELLRDLHQGRTASGVHRALLDVIKSGHSAYTSTVDRPGAWDAIGVVGSVMRSEALGWLAESLRSWDVPTNKDGTESKPWRNACDALAMTIEEKDWAKALSSGLLVKLAESRVSGGSPTFYRKPFEDGLVEALDPLLDHAAHALSTLHNARTRAMHALLEGFDLTYTEEKLRRGTLTFSDPTRMLMHARVTEDLEHLYFRIDGALRHVMLDEFQDTSMTQFALLAPILDELLSQDDPSRSTLIVGDVKQSLYAWRDAEPMLMHRLDRRWVFDTKPLTESWRSSPVVLELVDRVFRGMSRNPALLKEDDGAGREAADLWIDYPEHKAAKESMPGHATLRVVEMDEDSKEDDALLDAAADRVKELVGLEDDRSIAVIVRSGKHIAPMIARLGVKDIRASEERGNPLVDAPCVAAVVSVLTLSVDPANSAARYHAASTPIGRLLGITREPSEGSSRACSIVRARCAQDGISGVVLGWIPELAPTTDARGVARLEQLAALADTLARQGRASIEELLREVETKRIQDPGRGGVRVMTIHKSKGLEYDSVIVPLSSRAWSLDPKSVLTRREGELGPIEAVTRYPDSTMRLIHPELRAMYEHALALSLNEELCCLYVAMTRSRSTLDLLMAPVKVPKRGDPELKRNARDVVRCAVVPEEPCVEPGIVWESGADAPIVGAGTEERDRPMVRLLVSDRGTTSYETGSASRAARVSGSFLLGSDSSQREAMSMGDLIHRAFESVGWVEEAGELDPGAFEESIGADSERGTIAANIAARAFKADSVRSVFSRERFEGAHPGIDEAMALREHPFAVRLDDGRLLNGRFDRIALGIKDGRVVSCEIVDFKSDSVPEGWDQGTLESMAMKHEHQMRGYRDAAISMYGLEPGSVSCTIVFTSAPGCAPVTL